MEALVNDRAAAIGREPTQGTPDPGLGLPDLGELLPEAQAPPSKRDSARRRLLALADLLGLFAAFACVWALVPPDAELSQRLVLVAAGPLWVLIHKLLGLYDRDANLIHSSTLDELPRIVMSIVVGTALVYMVSPPLVGFELARPQTVAFLGFALLWVPALRGAVRWLVVRRYSAERCIIVGSGFVASLLARKIAAHPEYGVKLVGFVDVLSDDGAQRNGHGGMLGELERFEEICRDHHVERVVIAFSSLSHEDLINVIRISKYLSLKITVVPRLFEVIGHAVEVDQLEGMTLLGLRGYLRTRSSLVLKRAIDVVASGLGLIVLSPLLLAIALAVKLSSRGPVLFAQERIGRGATPFRMLKFRTTMHGADGLKVLRRLSLDELPQLINVLKGEMSLVGPRPLVPSEDDQVIGRHRERLDLTPGLTGPWQVMGRTIIPFQEMVKLDYLYVAEWSLWNDIKILIRTARVVLRAEGV